MTTEPIEQNAKTVDVHYLRSPLFRVVHMNGVFGGITPSGEIMAAFYVDRASIPDEITYSIVERRMGDEVSRIPEDGGFERELQVEVRMSLEQAVRFRGWLDDKITMLGMAREAIQSQESAEAVSPQKDDD